MQKRDIILTAVFSTLAGLILLAVGLFACYWCHKRKRKRDTDDMDECEGGNSPTVTLPTTSAVHVEEKKSRLNGFLNLKTPLISTKTLG